MISIDDSVARAEAVSLLRFGRLVAFPTETVYGLGADAANDHAVAEIFSTKGRPQFNPLILHLAEASWADRYAVLTPLAEKLMAAFWPGPLTLVMERRKDAPVSFLVSAGLDTIALRVPGHDGARRLIAAFGHAVAAPSANRSGRVSPTEAAHVAAEFAGQDEPALILDGGPCQVGLESTIVDLTSEVPRLLRPGGVTLAELKTAIPGIDYFSPAGKILAPGMMESHYAPGRAVRLDAMPMPGEAFLAFGTDSFRHDGPWLNLSETGNLTQAASRLFAYLRRLDDAAGAHAIAVAPIPEEGLGIAINDRLRRAAAPREKTA